MFWGRRQEDADSQYLSVIPGKQFTHLLWGFWLNNLLTLSDSAKCLKNTNETKPYHTHTPTKIWSDTKMLRAKEEKYIGDPH